MKKALALMLSVMVALTSIATFGTNHVVHAADTYQSLSSIDTTSLTIDDFTLDESSETAVETFNVSSSVAGVSLEVIGPVGGSGIGYFGLNETLTPAYDSTTVIQFNAVETNKYVQYKPFIEDSAGNKHNINSFITDGNTASVTGGDEIIMVIDWSAGTSKVYRNGVEQDSLKTYPTQTALSGGLKIGFVVASEKATSTTLKPRSVTVSDLEIWETSADALSCTVESVTEGTAQIKFNMPLFEEPVITINGSAVTATKVNAVTYTVDTSDLEVGSHTVSVSAESITSLNADYAYVVKAASNYKGLLTPDTTSLTEDDFTITVDQPTYVDASVSSDANGTLLETIGTASNKGNVTFLLDESFTPNYNSTTVIHFNSVESKKNVKFKPYIKTSTKTYNFADYVTDDATSSVDGGDEVVLVIDWSNRTSKMYRNGEAVLTADGAENALKSFAPTEAELSSVQLGFVIPTAGADRSVTVSDLEIWEASGDPSLSYTVESTTPGITTIKFNMPLFKAPTITIDDVAVTATKVNSRTYTLITSDLEAGDYTVSVTAASLDSIENQEATITISGFGADDKGVAKLSYSNGTLYLTKKPGATFSAWIIKVEYNDDDTIKNLTTLAKGITDSTSIPTTNAAGVKTRYFVWSDNGKLEPLGEPLEIRMPKYTEEYDEPKYTLSKSTDVVSTNITTAAGSVYYARVYAYGKDANHSLTMSVKEGDTVTQTYPYFVSTQLTAVYLPFTATGNETSVEVTSADGGTFYVSDPEIEKSDYKYYQTKSGTYLIASKDWTYDVVTVNGTDGLLNNPNDGDDRGVTVNTNHRTMDSIVVGDYMYALRNGRVHVLERTADSFQWIGATEYYGELREMDVTSDQKGIVVVGRNYGVFAFDISEDPTAPKLASHIDSLEMSSGLDIFGDYLYVADRNFGITIFNIADLENPRFVSNIPTGETQNVCYYNGYVYAGVWKESVVRVCDVRDVNNPKILEPISISGRGDGVLVKDGILYALTGQHAPGHSGTAALGFGLGFGLELWNIEDPNNPERLSVVHFDGAEYVTNPDVWRVESYGDKYICATGVFGGAYIYDVSDPQKPVRVAQYQALGETTPNSRWTTDSKLAHQRDPETGSHTLLALENNRITYPVIGITIDGDKLYLGTALYDASNNLYEAQLPFNMGSRDANSSTTDVREIGTPYHMLDYKTLFGENAEYYNSGTQIRAAAEKGDYLYLAAGTEGIIILDKATMTKVGSVDSLDITKDIQIYGDYLYTAEASEGVAIYKIDAEDPTKLTLQGSNAFDQAVVQLQLSPDARYALAHIGNTGAVLDLRDKTAPEIYKMADAFTMVYQNQMSVGCIGNRYLMMYTHVQHYLLCDFGPNGSYEEPIIKQWQDKKIGASGLCADGDNVILGGGGTKIYRFNPGDWDTTKSFTDQFGVYANYANMGQCPVVLGDYMFVMHRHKGNSRILKLSEDRTSATTVKINDELPANPNMPISDGERYYLPLGFAGIVSIDMADLEP